MKLFSLEKSQSKLDANELAMKAKKTRVYVASETDMIDLSFQISDIIISDIKIYMLNWFQSSLLCLII